ncbi:MAG: response regulator [Actinobacteria bacterium]|nr:response regulator [Actinomycetota bacterium]
MAERVLIIEDNEQNLKLARDLLQYHGYETLVARTAAEGVALAETGNPDLILLDDRLPDGDGLATLARLRGMDATAAVPVVAVTASAMSGDRERLLQAGFDGYLSKPLDSRAFPDQIRGFCRPGST